MKNLKNLLVISALSFFSTLGMAQSPFATIASNIGRGEVRTEAFSAKTVQVGQRLSFNIRGDVRNSFLFNTGAFYTPISGKNFAVPVLTSIGFGQTDSLSTNKGVSIAALPWISVYNEGGLQVVAHAGLVYQLEDIANTAANDHLKISVGVEAAFSKDGGPSSVVSLTPAWIKSFATNESLFGLEVSALFPVTSGLGLLAESLIPFDDSVGTGVNLGIAVNLNSIGK